MDFRRIGIDQLPEIQQVIEDAFSAEPWQDDWRDRQQFDQYVSDLVNQPNSLALGLFDGDLLVAISLGRVIHWFEGTQYHVDDLGVRTSMQGSGIGSLLLQRIEEYAARNGIGSISLKTNRQAATYRFYLRNGFTEQSDNVYFEKQVAPSDPDF